MSTKLIEDSIASKSSTIWSDSENTGSCHSLSWVQGFGCCRCSWRPQWYIMYLVSGPFTSRRRRSDLDHDARKNTYQKPWPRILYQHVYIDYVITCMTDRKQPHMLYQTYVAYRKHLQVWYDIICLSYRVTNARYHYSVWKCKNRVVCL